jgi:hypothetical protein
LRISAIFGQPENVMFCAIYDIIAKVAAAQRFPAWMLLIDARKCHEMCGCVAFHDICEGCITLLLSATPHSITTLVRASRYD